MQQILVLSGKGGTGKTSITASLASLARNSIFVDCDVDAADMFLIFKPQNFQSHNFKGGEKAVINYARCINCNRCIDVCKFEAISNDGEKPVINQYKCDGCRLCARLCPTMAIEMRFEENNYWYVGNTRFGKLVHARLAPGEDNSGKLVSRIREEASKIAKEENLDYIIIDGPPGIGCPVISSISGVNKVLIITEPTVSGLHDLKRLVQLLQKMNKLFYILVNKADLNSDITNEIEKYCNSENISLIEKIDFDLSMPKSMIDEQNIIEYAPQSPIADKIRKIWNEYLK